MHEKFSTFALSTLKDSIVHSDVVTDAQDRQTLDEIVATTIKDPELKEILINAAKNPLLNPIAGDARKTPARARGRSQGAPARARSRTPRGAKNASVTPARRQESVGPLGFAEVAGVPGDVEDAVVEALSARGRTFRSLGGELHRCDGVVRWYWSDSSDGSPNDPIERDFLQTLENHSAVDGVARSLELGRAVAPGGSCLRWLFVEGGRLTGFRYGVVFERATFAVGWARDL